MLNDENFNSPRFDVWNTSALPSFTPSLLQIYRLHLVTTTDGSWSLWALNQLRAPRKNCNFSQKFSLYRAIWAPIGPASWMIQPWSQQH